MVLSESAKLQELLPLLVDILLDLLDDRGPPLILEVLEPALGIEPVGDRLLLHLSAALPWEGEGVPLPIVSPSPVLSLCIYVMNVTHRNKTHKSHIKAPQKPIRSSKTYILIVKYTLSIYI